MNSDTEQPFYLLTKHICYGGDVFGTDVSEWALIKYADDWIMFGLITITFSLSINTSTCKCWCQTDPLCGKYRCLSFNLENFEDLRIPKSVKCC